jgi:hypothetical protein
MAASCARPQANLGQHKLEQTLSCIGLTMCNLEDLMKQQVASVSRCGKPQDCNAAAQALAGVELLYLSDRFVITTGPPTAVSSNSTVIHSC